MAVKEHISKATPPAPTVGDAARLQCSGGVGALSNWPGKTMHNVLTMLLGLAKRDQKTWAARQLFPQSCAQAQGKASLARCAKRARVAS